MPEVSKKEVRKEKRSWGREGGKEKEKNEGEIREGKDRGLGEPGPLQKDSDHSLLVFSREAGEKPAVVVAEPHFHSPGIWFVRTTILSLSA